MTDWRDAPIVVAKPGLLGWALVALRGLTLGAVTYGGLLLLLLLRLIERPLFGQQRPITPFITQFVCRAAFVILRMPIIVRGQPMRQKGAVVANHASWLDIFALNAAQRIYFVAKSEVERWAGIGWLARATGTVFITRKGTEAKRQQEIFEDRLRALRTVLEERFVKRGVSLRGLDWGKIEPATGESVRQVVTVTVGINSDKAREINKLIKEKGPKGIASQTQGEQVRVTGKKRDDLQAVMALLKSEDLGVPLQFENFRD